MKIAVLDADTFCADLDISRLEQFGNVKVFGNSAPDEISANLAGCEVAIINKIKINAQTIGGASSLRLICIAATGYDGIDLEYCRSRSIAVCNVAGYSSDSVAQLTLSMVLSLTTHLPSYSSYVSSGAYSKSGKANLLEPVYHEISGKTWGIAGFGNIGKKVGNIAKAFGCRVIAYSRTPKDGVENVDLDTLCRESDIISVHLPLNGETRGIFGKTEIAKMKSSAIFINVSRGAVADEAALAEAIKSGQLAGLGVDVYSVEPFDKSHPFTEILGYENVCLTPHMAWGSLEARVRCFNEICENIASFIEGGKRSRVD